MKVVSTALFPVKRVLRAFWIACVRLVDDGGVVIASNVALSLLLSLFPFLMLIASLVRLYGSPEMANTVVDIVLGHWPAGSADAIRDQIVVLLAQSPTEFFSFSTLIALVLATNGVENARDGLNRAYKVTERRSFLRRRIQAAVFVVVGAIGLIAVAFMLVGVPILMAYFRRHLPVTDISILMTEAAPYLLAVLMLWGILLAFHKLLPDLKGEHRAMRWGIGLTIVGILAGSQIFGLYLQNIANYTALYAGLAGMMVAIVYLYCLSVLLLFGAEFNTVYTELRAQERAESARLQAQIAARHEARRSKQEAKLAAKKSRLMRPPPQAV